MKLSEILKRAKFERGNKYVILKLNFANIKDGKDIYDIYTYALSLVAKMPKNSMSLLFDLRGLIINIDVEEQLKIMTKNCYKYFVASAIIVDANAKKIMDSIANELGLAKMITYEDIETANNYLINGN